MRVWKVLGAILIVGLVPLRGSAQTPSMDQVVDRIVTQEKAEMQMLRQYSPLVETYIQMLRPDAKLGSDSGRRPLLSRESSIGEWSRPGSFCRR